MMLQTLVENAIKHGLEPRTGGGTVWILATEADGRVAVTVADDGLGFSRQGGGTGIGLRTCASACAWPTATRRRFAIVANFPTGVAATITVPATERSSGWHRHGQPAGRTVTMARCVVAEDEALLREALVALLAQAWPELEIVAECEDGGSALEAIAEHQPDVAFLDIRMPGLTGLEVAAAAVEPARARRWCSSPPTTSTRSTPSTRARSTTCSSRSRAERLAADRATPAARASAAAIADADALAALLRELGARAAAQDRRAHRWSGSPRAPAMRRA